VADASIQFGLNHMVGPGLSLEALFAMAKALGAAGVEIRNDIDGKPILDGTKPEMVRSLADANGVSIISINALQRFNEWNEGRAKEAGELVDYAAACGAKALVLVPKNDGTGCGDGERQANLRTALKHLQPMLKQAGIIGLVEPLGFASCSLRLKSEALAAIKDTPGGEVFKLVHDTFHHHVAGEMQFFPEMTGLVHISGVSDASVKFEDMRDSHRELVDRNDRAGNVSQIRALLEGGYRGPLSFEPFARTVHEMPDLKGAVAASMAWITSQAHRAAA
jgi:2-keto-myo-inositol isomerase